MANSASRTPRRLDHRVNAYRGAVGEVANLSGVNALMLLKLRQPGNDFAAWLIRSRQDFQGVNLVRLLIEHGEIGKDPPISTPTRYRISG